MGDREHAVGSTKPSLPRVFATRLPSAILQYACDPTVLKARSRPAMH